MSSSTILDPQHPYLNRHITTLTAHSEGHSRRESLSLFDSLVNENESESIDAVALALTSEEIEQSDECTNPAFSTFNEPPKDLAPKHFKDKSSSGDKPPSPFFFANWNTDEDENEEEDQSGLSPSFDPDQTIVPGDIRIARLSLSANEAPSKNSLSRPNPPSNLQSMPQYPPSIEDIRKRLARIKNAPALPGSRRDAPGISFTPSTPNLGKHELPTRASPHGKRSLLPTVNLDEETIQVHRVSHLFKYQNENTQLGTALTREPDRRMSVPGQAALHSSNGQTSTASSAQTTSLHDSHIGVDKRTPGTAVQMQKNQMGLLPTQDKHRSGHPNYSIHSQVTQSVQEASVPKKTHVPVKKDLSFKTNVGYTSSLPAGKLPAPQMATKPRSLAPPTSSRVPLTHLKQPDLPSQVSKLNRSTLSKARTLASKLPAPSTGLRPPSQLLPMQRGSAIKSIQRPSDGQGSRK